ncbi:hypothetical protein C8N47_1339 [Mangrovibacterium marinum]|uniref:Uncharacterized protein n=1 Tax=Mangrovibacterium marinum TaxID=1639118 RepID=A0A2T5BX34_9BACT|nr:hypothetical protein [Mangrovibacterium marinum]PTN04244.1 hypothetical protein C8N47_1339 [Mangrovibacterium marinum]
MTKTIALFSNSTAFVLEGCLAVSNGMNRQEWIEEVAARDNLLFNDLPLTIGRRRKRSHSHRLLDFQIVGLLDERIEGLKD